MSADTHTRDSVTEDSGVRSDTVRETAFVLGAIAGTLVFAIGFGFFVIALTTGTGPPAPYFQSAFDKYLVVAGSCASMAVGALGVRGAMRFAGW